MSINISGFELVDSESLSDSSGVDEADLELTNGHHRGEHFNACPIDVSPTSATQSRSSSFMSSLGQSESGSSFSYHSGSVSFDLADDCCGDDEADDERAMKESGLITKKEQDTLSTSLMTRISTYFMQAMSQSSTTDLASLRSIGSSTSFRTQSSSAGSSIVDLARSRAINNRLAIAEEKSLERQRSVAKQAEAAKRRELKSQMSSKVLEGMWRTILAVVGFTQDLKGTIKASNSEPDHISDAAQRFARKLRLKQLSSLPRPTVTQLKTDKLLSLYPEQHLTKFASRMVLKYYFAGETVMCQNCVEDETLVLCRGDVDVVVSQVVLSTISTPETVLGSMGMISGEPRTASIIAKTNCALWSGTRLGFDVFIANTAAAVKLIREQRNANFHEVHHLMLASASLAEYPLLRGISTDALRTLSECGEPLIATKKRATILAPTDALASTALLLVAGTATLVLRRSHSQSPEKLAEALAWAADFPRGQKNFLRPLRPKRDVTVEAKEGLKKRQTKQTKGQAKRNQESSPASGATAVQIPDLLRYLKFQVERGLPDADGESRGYSCWQDEDDDEQEVLETKNDDDDDDGYFLDDSLDYVPIAELTAPCLINFAPMALRKWVGIGVLTKSAGVEALVLRREQLFEALSLTTIRKLSTNACKSTYKLIRAPPPPMLPKIFCEKFPSALQPLQHLHFEQLHTSPFSFPEGWPLEFIQVGNDSQRCYIITKGELTLEGRTTTSHSLPFLWPQLPVIFYGTDYKMAKCRTAVEGVSFRRSALLQLLNRDIVDLATQKSFVHRMEELYFTVTKHVPKAIANEGFLDLSWFFPRRLAYDSLSLSVMMGTTAKVSEADLLPCELPPTSTENSKVELPISTMKSTDLSATKAAESLAQQPLQSPNKKSVEELGSFRAFVTEPHDEPSAQPPEQAFSLPAVNTEAQPHEFQSLPRPFGVVSRVPAEHAEKRIVRRIVPNPPVTPGSPRRFARSVVEPARSSAFHHRQNVTKKTGDSVLDAAKNFSTSVAIPLICDFNVRLAPDSAGRQSLRSSSTFHRQQDDGAMLPQRYLPTLHRCPPIQSVLERRVTSIFRSAAAAEAEAQAVKIKANFSERIWN